MSLKILFWNINKKGNEAIEKIKNVTEEVDILLLCESNIKDDLIESELKLKRIPFKSDFDFSDLTPKLYSNLKAGILEHYSNSPSKRLSFYTLKTVDFGEIILAGIHFPSKLYYDGNSQLNIAVSYNKWIKDIEKLRSHKRTIVIGDFNMNPFEEGMIQPSGFNSTLSSKIAKSGQRTFHYCKYDFFYNPMWNWLGDKEHNSGKDKLPGSYYFKTSSDANQIFWNMFDNVIIRPEIIDTIDYTTLKILEVFDMDNTNDNVKFTDHLPLTFNLKISVNE